MSINEAGLHLLTTSSFSPYDFSYNCDVNPSASQGHASMFFNEATVRSALHAPSKELGACNATVYNTLTQEEVQPPAYHILPTLIKGGILVHLYSGEDDFFTNYLGIEMVIQNMTWYVCRSIIPKHKPWSLTLPGSVSKVFSRHRTELSLWMAMLLAYGLLR